MQPIHIPADGGTRVSFGVDWVIKLGERGHGRGVALVTYTTCAGEEPPLHTHPTEDEIFVVLSGAMTFVVDGARFAAATGSIMVLPAGVPHTYEIDAAGPVTLLVITYPVGIYGDGWGGFVAEMEALGTEGRDADS